MKITLHSILASLFTRHGHGHGNGHGNGNDKNTTFETVFWVKDDWPQNSKKKFQKRFLKDLMENHK